MNDTSSHPQFAQKPRSHTAQQPRMQTTQQSRSQYVQSQRSQSTQPTTPHTAQQPKTQAEQRKSDPYANLSPEERALRKQEDKLAEAKKRLANAKAKKERALGIALLETVSDDLTIAEWQGMLSAYPEIVSKLREFFSEVTHRNPSPRPKKKPRKKVGNV